MFDISMPLTIKKASKVVGTAILREIDEVASVQQAKGEFAKERTELLVQRRLIKNVGKKRTMVEANHDLVVELSADTKDYSAMESAITSFLDGKPAKPTVEETKG